MMAFLKQSWPAILAIIGLIIGHLLKKRPVVIGTDPEQKQAEEVDAKGSAEADVVKDRQKQVATDEAKAAEKALLAVEMKRTEELAKDEAATNDFLKKIGDDVRKP